MYIRNITRLSLEQKLIISGSSFPMWSWELAPGTAMVVEVLSHICVPVFKHEMHMKSELAERRIVYSRRKAQSRRKNQTKKAEVARRTICLIWKRRPRNPGMNAELESVWTMATRNVAVGAVSSHCCNWRNSIEVECRVLWDWTAAPRPRVSSHPGWVLCELHAKIGEI